MNQPVNLLELIEEKGPLTMDSLGPCIGDDAGDDATIWLDGNNANSKHSQIEVQSGPRTK